MSKHKDEKSGFEEKDGEAVLHYQVYAHEGFEESARKILALIRHAQEDLPGKRRLLVVNIDEHRNPVGGFDSDMYRLQTDFLIRCLFLYLTEIHLPLGSYRNTRPQQDDVPEGVAFVYEDALN